MIAELLEFLDHSGSARTLGLGTDRRTAFLVVDSLMQNLPKHSAKSMGYGPDCLFVSQARQQPAKRSRQNCRVGFPLRQSLPHAPRTEPQQIRHRSEERRVGQE